MTASGLAIVHRNLIITLAAAQAAGDLLGTVLRRCRRPMSYGPDLVEQFRQAAGYVDRILKGEKPGNLPVQAATKYEPVINLKTAKRSASPCRTNCSLPPTR